MPVPSTGLLAGAGLLLGGTASVVLARRLESVRVDRLARGLEARTSSSGTAAKNEAPAALPEPVARYFRNNSQAGLPLITAADLHQSGMLRTGSGSRWLAFTARQSVRPPATGFLWDARVALPLGMHLRVVDGYVDGHGSGRISFQSTVPVGTERGGAELDAGALHRYLAEAVWYPTALLPQNGAVWQAVDERRAIATLTQGEIHVSLEFRFNAVGEIVGVYSPGRYRRCGSEYRLAAWEGRFLDYRRVAGMRVPRYGELGWYEGDRLVPVWKGQIRDARYRFA